MNKKSTPLYRETHLGGRLTPFKGVWPVIGSGCFVFHGSQIVGDVVLGEGVSVWHNAVVRGDVNHIRIGDRTNIQDGAVIHVSTNTYPTIIGKDVLVAHMAMLHGCTLQDFAFVGMGALVMDNATVEGNGMLAAGALLAPGKTVGAGQLWAGRPARFMRDLTSDEIEKNRNMAEHYRKLALQHECDARGEIAQHPYP